MKRSAFFQAAAFLLLLAGGCLLDQPGSGSLASIVIENSHFSPGYGTTGASPVGTTFAISTRIYEIITSCQKTKKH